MLLMLLVEIEDLEENCRVMDIPIIEYSSLKSINSGAAFVLYDKNRRSIWRTVARVVKTTQEKDDIRPESYFLRLQNEILRIRSFIDNYNKNNGINKITFKPFVGLKGV